jgi:hypothetical protein
MSHDQGLLGELAELMKEEANESDASAQSIATPIKNTEQVRSPFGDYNWNSGGLFKNKPQASYLFGNAAQRPSLFNSEKPSIFGKTGTSTLGSG